MPFDDTSGDGRAEVYAALSPWRGISAVYQLPGAPSEVLTAKTVRLRRADYQPEPPLGSLEFARSLG